MAIAVKTEPLPEIIEVIDDDADSLAYRTTTPSPEPAGPGVSRWIGPAAAAVLLVVVGIAVVSSAVDSKPSRPATPGLIKPEYFVADAPSGFSMFLAEARGEDGVDTAHFADAPAAELWATPDASATTGSWFVVSRGAQHSTGRNSYRTIVDGIEVVVEHDPASGQRRMSFTKDGQEMAITAFGWFDRQLVRLVRAVNVDGSAIRFSDGFFTSDHDRILLADPVSALFGLPVARVGYTTGSPSTLAETFTITVAGDNVQNEPQVARFALTHLASFNIGTTRAMIGQSAADPTFRIAQWHDGERLISIYGNLDTSRLEAIARTVHRSSSSDVHAQLDAAKPPLVAELQVEPHTVVSGMLADGWGWTIQVSSANPADTNPGYLWWIGQPGDAITPSETRPSLPGNAPSIDTFVEHGRTYVLASVPRSMAGAKLHVAPTGLPSIVTDLSDADPTLPREFAAAVFPQPVPFSAWIVDADGTTVAVWPTFGGTDP